MFSLNCAFCNLRFRFRFLDVPLGIKSKLIIVFNFLHLAPKTSANKPASRGYTMASRNPIKGMLRQSGALLIGICSPRRNKGRPKIEGVGYTSCLPISFTLSRYRLNPINDERALFLSFLFLSPPLHPASGWEGPWGHSRPGCLQADQVPTHSEKKNLYSQAAPRNASVTTKSSLKVGLAEGQ